MEHAVAVYKFWYECRDHLPMKSRYVLADRIDMHCIQTLELLFIASYQSREEKLPTIRTALRKIDILKSLIRIVWELRALDSKRYATLSEKIDELGRMLGGWKKGLESKTPAPKNGDGRMS
ncbi:MAG: four helix bundle protein [Minisyncoccia bacterium]